MRKLKSLLESTKESLQAFGHPRVSVAWQDKDLVYRHVIGQAPGIGESIIGKRLEDVVGTTAESRRLTAVKRKVLKTGRPHHETVTLPIGDELRTFDLAIEPTYGPEGELDGLTSVNIDITDLEITRKRLEEANQRLVDILDHALGTDLPTPPRRG